MAEPATLDSAREALRLRQGLGARYDAPGAPAEALDWARRGTAYFARKLNELSDADLARPSRVPDWTRRSVVACTAYHARMLTRVTETARTGLIREPYASPGQRDEEIEDGATLPSGALRHLAAHAAVHLNVEWRDLSSEAWDAPLSFAGTPAARATPWLRARQVWLRALDLRNGADPRDFPRAFLVALLTEKLGAAPAAGDLPALARDVLTPSAQDY